MFYEVGGAAVGPQVRHRLVASPQKEMWAQPGTDKHKQDIAKRGRVQMVLSDPFPVPVYFLVLL